MKKNGSSHPGAFTHATEWHAAITWRADRWPVQPEEHGTYLYPSIPRVAHEQHGSFKFSPGAQSRIYLQVYFAIPDYNAIEQITRWFYSRNDSVTSKQEVVIQ